MSAKRPRVWPLYPSVFGRLDFDGLLKVAREEGMVVVGGFKANMCVSVSLALAGSTRQRQRVVARWRSFGHDLIPARKTSLYWAIRTDIKREDWHDVKRSEDRHAIRVHFGYLRFGGAA